MLAVVRYATHSAFRTVSVLSVLAVCGFLIFPLWWIAGALFFFAAATQRPREILFVGCATLASVGIILGLMLGIGPVFPLTLFTLKVLLPAVLCAYIAHYRKNGSAVLYTAFAYTTLLFIIFSIIAHGAPVLYVVDILQQYGIEALLTYISNIQHDAPLHTLAERLIQYELFSLTAQTVLIAVLGQRYLRVLCENKLAHVARIQTARIQTARIHRTILLCGLVFVLSVHFMPYHAVWRGLADNTIVLLALFGFCALHRLLYGDNKRTLRIAIYVLCSILLLIAYNVLVYAFVLLACMDAAHIFAKKDRIDVP